MDKVVGQMAEAWWVTPNEKRAAMSYGVDEDNEKLNDYYVPANLLPMSVEVIEIEPKNIDIDYNELLKSQVPGLPNVYTTVQEAINRARELGGDGYHSHVHNGGTVFMPFDTHEQFEAIQRGDYDQSQSAYDEGEDEKELLLKESFNDYPQAATNNARRMIEWREKYGRDVVKGGTEVGWQRASQLAKREKLSVDVISRMAQFNRHRENAEINPKFKDEPWKDNGYVAWNLWGGSAGVDWAIRKMKKIRGE